ncbi:hypothetical protein TRFO_12057 [Tritrichomonas foetus]|uniref:Uncharacterized protein n=1 Tax=Tritrichomonas foetus TaxID=1144522 RepID=A0A1J4J0D7_9EUKA|nr:hypothetical protein TRFO_12057 [Tritrichomonas foetus]|eukprot:OHS93048.1 hypothetical protein TRFO_12057 [Tritrichomonas foetus]
MEEKYEFFLQHIPNNVDTVLTTTMYLINETRDNIIRCHRTVALSRILFERDKKIYGDLIPDELHLPSFVMKPNEVVPPRVSPQLLQQSAHLFAFLHLRLADLFDALILVKSTPEFPYLINSALPALFGYFSSKEHILLAFPFYYHTIDLSSPQLTFKIAYPFLAAPYIFRFFESSLMPFFSRFLRDNRIENCKANKRRLNELSKIYANDLIDLFIQNLHLLPNFFTVFFKMAQKKWDHKIIGDFLVNELFKDISFKFLVTFGYEKNEPFLENVFSQMTVDHFVKLSTALCKSKSSFEVPELFMNFGHSFYDFYVCIPDLVALSKVIEMKTKLPASMTSLPFDNTPRFSMFWFKVFPKRKIPLDLRVRPLIFSDTQFQINQNPVYERSWLQMQSQFEYPYEYCKSCQNIKDQNFIKYVLLRSVEDFNHRASEFEELMSFKLWLSEIKKWGEIAYEQERLMIMPIAILATQQAHRREYKTLEIAFEHSSTLFSSTIIQKDQFLSLISLYLPNFISKINKDLKALDDEWSKFTYDRSKDFDLINIGLENQSSNAVFWESVEELRTVTINGITAGFRGVIRSFQFLKGLLKVLPKDLTEIAIILAQNKEILIFYIIVNSFAMKNKVFHSLCTDEEEGLWVKFESVLLRMVTSQSNMKLQNLFFQVQDKTANLRK